MPALHAPFMRSRSFPWVGALPRKLAEHRRMARLQRLAVAQIHVHAAWQARVEAAYGAHNIYAFEIVRPVLFEDRRALHRVLIRPRRSVDVTRAGVPRRRRVRVIIGDLSVTDHDV